MMNYFLTEEQEEIRQLARQIAVEHVKPVRAELDEKGEFPWAAIRTMGEADLFGVWIPEEFGGLGGGVLDLVLAMEEISRVCSGVGVSYAASALGSFPIILDASDELKERYLPDIASGKKLAAFALTEADAGSDAGAIRTTAVKKGDRYVLNGTKQWITNGGEAEIYTVIAMTNRDRGPRGASAFVVEKGTPGFSFGKKEDKMGIRCSATRELIFEDCEIPAANLIGKEGRGFTTAVKTLNRSRPGVGAQALGIAQGALDEACLYARQRAQGGKPIFSYQAVGHMLADMAMQVEAARALIYASARHVDQAQSEGEIAIYAAMSKCFPADVAMKVTTDAVQVLGGYGYMKEYPVEKMMRDAKITQIYEGTNQIQRNEIMQGLIKQYARFREL